MVDYVAFRLNCKLNRVEAKIEIQADKNHIELCSFTSKVMSLITKMLRNLFEECQQSFLKVNIHLEILFVMIKKEMTFFDSYVNSGTTT